MKHRIICSTKFDITATGVRHRHNRSAPTAYSESDSGTNRDWYRQRNQQRNWETVNQILSLRTLPEEITEPERQGDQWQFSFVIPDIAQTTLNTDPVGLIRQDIEQVPMITGLEESPGCLPYFRATGEDANIWFRCEQLNTSSEESPDA